MAGSGKKKRAFGRILLIAFFTCLFLSLCTLGVVLGVLSHYSKNLPDVEKLSQFEPSESSQIFSSDKGHVIGILYKENRIWVPVANIPQNMQNAIIATEDSRFYKHRGVDPVGVGRAIYQNLRGKSISQGASTITQQLARNIFLTQERSFGRKIQEMILSMQIEKRYTKKEILEFYLNQIYFGASAYGIEAAAQTYFGKHAKELTLPECAMIAGLPAAPSAYSPFVDEQAARDRQKVVLHRMMVCGFITPEEEQEAAGTELSYAQRKSEFQLLKYPYFTTYVMNELSKKYKTDYLYRGGLKIYTTVDLKMQKFAESALKEGLASAGQQNMHATNGAIVAIEPSRGFIKAMVGGLKYTVKNQFNRAWQARRQPGSSFKVFIYTTAIDNGYSPESLVDDSPVTYQRADNAPWCPKNSDGSYRGTMTFRDALKWSRNVCAVKLLDKLSVERVIEYAEKMGIKEPLEHNLTIALGSSVITPIEMASAFGVLANNGIRCEPTSIMYITDSRGNVIEDHRQPEQQEVLSEATAYTMTEMLEEVISSGTGTGARIDRPAAGKTGTTDESRDAWFVGFVPQLSCAVWIGNDDFSKMNNVYGGVVAAPIWGKFMKKALAGTKVQQFGADSKGKVGVIICEDTGLRATGTCTNTRKEYFSPDAVPRRFCTKHGPRSFPKTKAIIKESVTLPPPTTAPDSTEEPSASTTIEPDSTNAQDASPGASPGSSPGSSPGKKASPEKSRKIPLPETIMQRGPETPNTVAPTLMPGEDNMNKQGSGTPIYNLEEPPTEDKDTNIDISPPTNPDDGPEPQDSPKSQQL